METQFFAPDADVILYNTNQETDMVSRSIYRNLTKIYSVFSCVKPIGDDELRETWPEVKRGPIEAFGNFIGIVPDTVFQRYCHSLFPKEARIIDFTNLGSDKKNCTGNC